jgi:hypothetical protein
VTTGDNQDDPLPPIAARVPDDVDATNADVGGDGDGDDETADSADSESGILPLGYARPGTEQPGMNLVTIATFAQSWEAHLAAGKLEAAGIPAVLADENIVSTGGGLYTGLAGGIKLQVPQADAERALAELPSRVRVRQVKCPRCGSMDTHEVDYTLGLKFFFLLLLGLPYLFVRKPWMCLKCQYLWRAQSAPETVATATDSDLD